MQILQPNHPKDMTALTAEDDPEYHSMKEGFFFVGHPLMVLVLALCVVWLNNTSFLSLSLSLSLFELANELLCKTLRARKCL